MTRQLTKEEATQLQTAAEDLLVYFKVNNISHTEAMDVCLTVVGNLWRHYHKHPQEVKEGLDFILETYRKYYENWVAP